MSFARISTLALALAAGLAAPASAATLNGILSISFGSNWTTEFESLTYDPVVNATGSGSAGVTVITEAPADETNAPSGLDDDGLIVVDNLRSEDQIDLSTLSNVAGFAEFTIFRTFTFTTAGIGNGFVLFDIASDAVANSRGPGSTATLSVFVQMLGQQDGGQFVVPDEDGNGSVESLFQNVTDGASSGGGSLSVSYLVNDSTTYSFFVRIEGSVTEVDRGGGGPDPEPPVIPLPATALLLPLGLGALAALRRRKTG